MSNISAAAFSTADPPACTKKSKILGAWSYQDHGKRLFDIIYVLIALPVILPPILMLALAIFMYDFRNPFYFQDRVGRHGRIFRIWKLRSMVWNAESVLEHYLSEDPRARAEWNKTQKLQSDPRITSIGKLIRKTSIDELPQLWNVLKGDMSLIGPRPMLPEQQNMYPCSLYYTMRPGLSGFWQVSCRSRSSFSDRARFDRLYSARISLRTDIGVIKRTVTVILKGTGV